MQELGNVAGGETGDECQHLKVFVGASADQNDGGANRLPVGGVYRKRMLRRDERADRGCAFEPRVRDREAMAERRGAF